MRTTILLLACIVLSQQAQAQRYIFFLHNKFVEDEGLKGVHPEYGRVEYKEILEAFRKKGLVVISEVRPKGQDGIAYAHKTAWQVDSLRKKGVKSSDITI